MANNDILVQSSLQKLQNKVDVKQQDTSKVAPAAPVSVTSVKTNDVTAASQVDKQKEQQQEQVKALREKVAELNDHMQNLNRNILFSVDDKSGDTVIKVVDSETEELIRQIPSQEVLDVRNSVEKYRGLLFETKA